MKNTIILASCLYSFSTIACPNLAGTYRSCHSNQGTKSNLVMTQKLQNGVMVYTSSVTDDQTHKRSTEVGIADGKVRDTITTNGQGAKITNSTSYTCVGNTLKMHSVVSIANEVMVAVETVSAKQGNRLEMEITGVILGDDFRDHQTCD